jgi:hypothetical protein
MEKTLSDDKKQLFSLFEKSIDPLALLPSTGLNGKERKSKR